MSDCGVERLVAAVGRGCAEGVVPVLERTVTLLERQMTDREALEARVLELEALADVMKDLRGAFYPDNDDVRSAETT